MSHNINFQLPKPQWTILTALWNKACSAATVDGQAPPTKDDWLATTALRLLAAWLAYHQNNYPKGYPLLIAYSAGGSFTQSLAFTDATEAQATAYYAQYTADLAAAGRPPVPEDTLLSALAQRVMLDYCAKTATDPLVNFKLVSIPVGPVPQAAATPVAGPIPGPIPQTIGSVAYAGVLFTRPPRRRK